MSNVLNPKLYQALMRVFDGNVHIQNPGEHRRVSYMPDWSRGGRPKAVSERNGEYYCVNCPFCTDTRQRLYINYQWGERDEKTRDSNLHLANCFNEKCIKNSAYQRDLYNIVYPLGRVRGRAVVSSESAVDVPAPTPPVPELPIPSVPIHELGQNEEAAAYLLARGFDLGELWSNHGVRYCGQPLNAIPRFTRRIVIPVYDISPALPGVPPAERLAGWQARTIGNPIGDEPKYLSARGMRKSRLLYGLPRAIRSTGPVVLVEGPTDVWRLGENAIATFGKDVSQEQIRLIGCHFENRPVVLFPDEDALDNAKKVRSKLRAANPGATRPIVIAQLPPGRNDVGSCTHEEAWQQVRAALPS